MANVIGSGSPLVSWSAASWSVASPAPTLTANLAWSPAEAPRAAVSLDGNPLYAQLAELLRPHASGLALTQIREALGVPATEIRVVVEAALRARAIRRVGASSTLRYVLNARD